MRTSKIYRTLSDVGTWNHSTNEIKQAFIRQMRGRQYGWDALYDAWGWYLSGWKDANLTSMKEAIININSAENLRPSSVMGLEL